MHAYCKLCIVVCYFQFIGVKTRAQRDKRVLHVFAMMLTQNKEAVELNVAQCHQQSHHVFFIPDKKSSLDVVIDPLLKEMSKLDRKHDDCPTMINQF